MSVIDSGPQQAPVYNPPKGTDGSRSLGLIIGLAVLVLALLMITPFAAVGLLRGSESSSSEPVVELDEDSNAAPAGFAYFGDVAMAQGSTLTTTVTGEFISSTDDVEIVTMPDGVEALIFDAGDDIVQLEIKLATDVPVGPQVMSFRIAGEPETVDWLFQVLPR